MKRFFTSFLFSCFSYLAWSQTNPTAFDLSTGDFSFTTQTATSTTYPSSMQGWTTGTNNLIGSTTAAPGADQSLVASGVATTSGLSNLGANGFNFLSTSGSPNRQVGAICLALKTTGRTNIKVNWLADDQTSGSTREMNISLQYRIGTSGTFTDVSASTYTTSNSSDKASSNFSNISLPSDCDNKTVVQLRWITYESTSQSGGRDAIRLDDISVTSSASSSPTLSVSVSVSLPLTFSTTVVGQNSTSQTFNLSGSNFTNASGNITVTAPNTDFQVSSDNNTFGATATIPFTANTLTPTSVHVRFTPQSEGAKSGNITFSDPGGVTTLPTVSVSGTGACTTPSLVTSFSGTKGNTQSILNWTNGSCFDEMLVVARAGSAVSFTPSGDGSAYTANAAFGSGTDVGSSQFVVYKGTGTTQTVTSLTNGTTYYFAVYTRRGSNWSIAVAANATPVASTNASDYFRSNVASGLWSNVASWESSSDNNTWIPATLTPTSAANTITIRNGHTIRVTSESTADQLVVANGAILQCVTNSLNINNGTGDDITVENGGTVTYEIFPTYTSSTIRVNSGGVLRVQGNSMIGNGTGVNNSTTHFYDDGSILEYSISSTPSSSNVTFFPNADDVTVPIFRFASNIGGSYGATGPTTFKGILNIASDVTITFTGTGIKTLRNGLNGAGNLAQGTAGQIVINGNSAVLTGSGTLTLGTNGLSITNNNTINGDKVLAGTGGTLTKAGTGTLSLTGANTYTGLTTVSAGTLQLNRTGGTTIPATNNVTVTGGTLRVSSNQTLNNLIVNGGGVTVDDGVTLTISGTLTLTSGKITLGTGNIIVNGTISGGSATSYVATTGTGTLKVATGGLLPIGTASVYAPVTVTNTGAADNFSARVKSVAANGDFTCNTDVTKTVKLQWDVNEDVAGGSIATLIFQWAASEEGSSFNRNSAIFVSHCNGTAYDYVKSATLGGSNPYTATATDINSFSPFVIQNDNPLSAELLDFKAKPITNTVVLFWQTANEKDNAFFGIEHATNGNAFHEIAQVKGNGTTTQLTDYQYIHTTPSVGVNYYRLRQVDFNGTTTHSPIRSVWVSGNGKISLFPTVSSHEITLRTDDTEVNQTYEIYNMLGERVLFGEMQGQKTILISELSRGVYILKIKGENLKFVKE